MLRDCDCERWDLWFSHFMRVTIHKGAHLSQIHGTMSLCMSRDSGLEAAPNPWAGMVELREVGCLWGWRKGSLTRLSPVAPRGTRGPTVLSVPEDDQPHGVYPCAFLMFVQNASPGDSQCGQCKAVCNEAKF